MFKFVPDTTPTAPAESAVELSVRLMLNSKGGVNVMCKKAGSRNSEYILTTLQTNGTILRHWLPASTGWKQNDRSEAIFTRKVR